MAPNADSLDTSKASMPGEADAALWWEDEAIVRRRSPAPPMLLRSESPSGSEDHKVVEKKGVFPRSPSSSERRERWRRRRRYVNWVIYGTFLFASFFWAISILAASRSLGSYSSFPGCEAKDSRCLPREHSRILDIVSAHGLSSWHDVRSDWTGFQLSIESSLKDPSRWPQSRVPSPLRDSKLKVLAVAPVGNTAGSVDNWAGIVSRLMRNRHGDTFDFAFFHYSGSNDLWLREAWYADGESIRVRSLERGCKLDYWQTLGPPNIEIYGKYDYVWLIDEDLDFTFFDWDIFRSFLLRFSPVVATPAIVPVKEGMRGADYPNMKMRGGTAGGEVVLARSVPAIEVMAAVISTRVWPAIQERMRGREGRSDYGMDGWWSKLGRLAKEYCDGAQVGNLVVDATPLVHLDTRTIDNGERKPPKRPWNLWRFWERDDSVCKRRCLGNNCAPYTVDDVIYGVQALEDMYGRCSKIKWRDLQGGMIRAPFSGAHTIPLYQPQHLTHNSFKDNSPRGIYDRFAHRLAEDQGPPHSAGNTSDPVDMVYAIAMPERRAHISGILGKLGLRHKILDAITEDDLSVDDYASLSETFGKKNKLLFQQMSKLPVSLSFFVCYYDAYLKGYDRVAVLEDDVKITVEVPTLLGALTEFRETKDDACGLLLLGYCCADCRKVKRLSKRVSQNLFEFEGINFLCNHALVFKRELIERLVTREEATYWRNRNDHTLMKFILDKKEKVCVPPHSLVDQDREAFPLSSNGNEILPKNWKNVYPNGQPPPLGDFGCNLLL